jgi:hypothetical protein
MAVGRRLDDPVELIRSTLTRFYHADTRFTATSAFRLCQIHCELFPVQCEQVTRALDRLVTRRS